MTGKRIFYIQLSEETTDDEIAAVAAKLTGSPLKVGDFVLGTVNDVRIDLRYKTIGVVINWVDGIEVGSIITGR